MCFTSLEPNLFVVLTLNIWFTQTNYESQAQNEQPLSRVWICSSETRGPLLEDHKGKLFHVCDTSIWPRSKSYIIFPILAANKL